MYPQTEIRHPGRHPRRWLPALLACLAFAIGAAPSQAPAATFDAEGRGFGHGVGMSQWGAFGFASEGYNHRQILKRYYKGTRVEKLGGRKMKVLLSVRTKEVRFTRAKQACGVDLDSGKTYVASMDRKGKVVRLERPDGERLTRCGRRLAAKSSKRISIDGEGTFRGRLVARPTDGGLLVINNVALESYLRGVVPREVPAGWPVEALKAQAVAARTYALTTSVNGDGFNAYADTRSQVYGGVAAEQPTTNKAIRQTRARAVTYEGDAVTTFFFSSSGGRTESSQFGFSGGSGFPYLRSVRDPFDKASPDHRWKVSFSRAEIESLLSGRFGGKLKKIEPVKTGDSPRIVEAKIVGSKGSSRISGSDLRAVLGLKSTWVRFSKG